MSFTKDFLAKILTEASEKKTMWRWKPATKSERRSKWYFTLSPIAGDQEFRTHQSENPTKFHPIHRKKKKLAKKAELRWGRLWWHGKREFPWGWGGMSPFLKSFHSSGLNAAGVTGNYLADIWYSFSWFCICQIWREKTSQELRMLSSVTINCQITKIVMNSGSQLSEL